MNNNWNDSEKLLNLKKEILDFEKQFEKMKSLLKRKNIKK